MVSYNINEYVFVKLKEKGIEKYVKEHNEIMPFKMHISFKEFESKKDENGYHKFQMWSFMDHFGKLGMEAYKYFDTTIYFDENYIDRIY